MWSLRTYLFVSVSVCLHVCTHICSALFVKIKKRCRNGVPVRYTTKKALHICILQGIKNNITRRSNHPLRKLQGFVLSVRNWSNNIYIVIYRIIIHWKEIKKKINIFNKVVGNMVRRNYIVTRLKLIMLRSNIMT